MEAIDQKVLMLKRSLLQSDNIRIVNSRVRTPFHCHHLEGFNQQIHALIFSSSAELQLE